MPFLPTTEHTHVDLLGALAVDAEQSDLRDSVALWYKKIVSSR